jgi:hypothetical protein
MEGGPTRPAPSGGAHPVKLLATIVIAVSVVAGLAPSPVTAHGPRGGSPGFHAGRPAGSSARIGPRFVHNRSAPERSVLLQPPTDPWRFWPPPTAPKHRVRSRLDVPFTGFVGAPSLVAVTPTLVDAYGASFAAHEPVSLYPSSPIAAIAAPTALPTPTLIDFSTGWYQLRGDGVTTPYTWVWIPKPPGAPAARVEPSPPAPDPALAGPPAGPGSREARGPAYHWTDSGGVTTWTNRLDRIPRRFRDQAAASAEPD